MIENDNLEKLQRLDHDALIRVEENLKNIGADIKEMKDGTSLTLSDHEIRLKSIETIVQVVKPEQSLAEFRVLQQQWRDFGNNLRLLQLFWGALGAAIIFLITQVPNILRSWGVIN